MKAKIKLAFKQYIDKNSAGYFERAVFHASYQEFLLKSQAYNTGGRFQTFTQMKLNDGRSNSLHYKLGFSVGHYIGGLDGKIPGLIDNMGHRIDFEVPQFELIESDITNKDAHCVAIHYITPELNLAVKLGEYMVLASDEIVPGESAETITVKMCDNLSVISYRELSKNTYSGLPMFKVV